MADSTVFDGDEAAPRNPRPGPGHPKTIDMIVGAIRDNDDNPRKGTSVPAIKKWIEEHYPEVGKPRLKHLLKNALTKGLALGLIERPKKNDEATPVLVGHYRMGKSHKPAPKRAKKADLQTKKKAKGDGADEAHRGRSTTPKNVKKGKPIPRARARSVSATPRVSKSKKIRSRLSKSHSPLRTPKLIKPKAKTAAAAKKKIATSPAAKAAKAKKSPVKKSPAKKPAKKSPVAKATAKGGTAAKKTAKPAKPTKGAGKAAPKDGGKKRK